MVEETGTSHTNPESRVKYAISKVLTSAYSYAPKAQMPGCVYAVLQYQLQYYLLRDFGIFYVLVITSLL